MGTTAINSYADYEQLVGGVETLFGASGQSIQEYANATGKRIDEITSEYAQLMDAQNTVLKNASNAYKTAGLSANEYIETVTSFAASLKQSCETELEAADAADQAVIDMADNANKMGTSMESIQNAYQGFAKQNYTMLDNLKLGYGGTKTEMERLLADATALTGIEYDINSLSDVYEAIHVVQTELGITGTTAKEASSTISGSLNAMKASWSNLVIGIADDSMDFDKLVNNFVESVGVAAENILPRVEVAIIGCGKLIEKLLPSIVDAVPGIINNVLPDLFNSGIKMIDSLIEGMRVNIDELINSAFQIAGTLVKAFADLFPRFLELGIQLLAQLALGIAKALPTLIPTMIDVLLSIVDVLLANIGLLVDAAIQLITGLANGLINALPVLIERLPEIIMAIVNALIENIPVLVQASSAIIDTLTNGILENLPNLIASIPEIISSVVMALINAAPELLKAGFELITTLARALITYIPQLIQKIPQILNSLVNSFFENAPKLLKAGLKLITTLGDSLITYLPRLLAKIPQIVNNLVNEFMDLLGGFTEVGANIIDGIWSGISSGWDWLVGKVKGLADSLFGAAKEALGIHSPSRKFRWLAEMCVAGWNDGAEKLMNPQEMTKNINASLSTAQMNMAGAKVFSAGAGFGDFNQTININQQISTPDELARAIRIESRYGLMRGVAVG